MQRHSFSASEEAFASARALKQNERQVGTAVVIKPHRHQRHRLDECRSPGTGGLLPHCAWGRECPGLEIRLLVLLGHCVREEGDRRTVGFDLPLPFGDDSLCAIASLLVRYLGHGRGREHKDRFPLAVCELDFVVRELRASMQGAAIRKTPALRTP
jgi:hypothetical protein